MHTKFYSENLKGRDLLGNLGIDGRIIITWILEEYGVRLWAGLSWLEVGCSTEPSIFIKDKKFFWPV